MANDLKFFSLFQLCSDKNKFVYEVSSMFGNKLTLEEMDYWICFNIVNRAVYNDVDYRAFPLDEVISDIEKAEAKRKAKYAKK